MGTISLTQSMFRTLANTNDGNAMAAVAPRTARDVTLRQSARSASVA